MVCIKRKWLRSDLGLQFDRLGAATSGRIPAICSRMPATTATTGRLPRTLTAPTPTTSTSTAPAASIRPTTTIGTPDSPFAAFAVPDLRNYDFIRYRKSPALEGRGIGKAALCRAACTVFLLIIPS